MTNCSFTFFEIIYCKSELQYQICFDKDIGEQPISPIFKGAIGRSLHFMTDGIDVIYVTMHGNPYGTTGMNSLTKGTLTARY